MGWLGLTQFGFASLAMWQGCARRGAAALHTTGEAVALHFLHKHDLIEFSKPTQQSFIAWYLYLLIYNSYNVNRLFLRIFTPAYRRHLLLKLTQLWEFLNSPIFSRENVVAFFSVQRELFLKKLVSKSIFST